MRDTPRLGPCVGRRGDILPAALERFAPQMGQILAASLLCLSVRPAPYRRKRGANGRRAGASIEAPALLCTGCAVVVAGP